MHQALRRASRRLPALSIPLPAICDVSVAGINADRVTSMAARLRRGEHLRPVVLVPRQPCPRSIVRPGAPCLYELLDGRHRLMAALAAGRTLIPAVVIAAPCKKLS